MDIVAFAIWKFRNIEGYLQGMNSYDVNYSPPKGGELAVVSV